MRLRLLTCNMHYANPDPKKLQVLFADARPDVIALQEWPAANWSEVLAGPGWHVLRSEGLFLASRQPIRHAEALGAHSAGPRGLAARYELETAAGTVTLFSLHLASPREGLWRTSHGWWNGPADLRASSGLRWRQSAGLAQAADAVRGPVLLVGDFNTPSESAIFRGPWGRYSDAFCAAGCGWGYTFISGRAARVRIDHILAGAGWYCERCWVGPDVGSPHRPVLADMTWMAADPRGP
jgi:endonuclease/exonuclease/phosphatase (EEP) superfamily protein YafD